MWKFPLLCVRVAVSFRHLREIWFLSGELRHGCGTAPGTIVVIIALSTISPSILASFNKNGFLFDQGTHPLREDKMWINLYYYLLIWRGRLKLYVNNGLTHWFLCSCLLWITAHSLPVNAWGTSHSGLLSLSFSSLFWAYLRQRRSGRYTCCFGGSGGKIWNNEPFWLWIKQCSVGGVGGVILRAPVRRVLCRNPSVLLGANISGTNIVICSWGNLLFQS